MLEQAASQESVRRNPRPPSLRGQRVPRREALPNKVNQVIIIELRVEGLQQVVLDEGRLVAQGHVEERRFAGE